MPRLGYDPCLMVKRALAVLFVAGAAAGSVLAAAPDNDTFPGSPISGPTGSIAGSNVDATGVTGEPTALNGVSVWYTWTAPSESGAACFITSERSFDPVLGVWTGSAFSNLKLVAFDDDISYLNGLDVRAGVTFSAEANTTYAVGIGGAVSTLGSTGTFTLTWGPGCLPPETVIDSLVTGRNVATLTFHGTDDWTSASNLIFECRLDFGGAWVMPCPSPYTFTGVPGGFHSFFVRATDTNLNVDATPARANATVKGAKSRS